MDDDKTIDGTTCLEALKLICDKYFPDRCSFEQYKERKICFEDIDNFKHIVYFGCEKKKTNIYIWESYYEACCDVLKRLSTSKKDYLDLRMLFCCEIGILVKARRKEGSREPVYRMSKRS